MNLPHDIVDLHRIVKEAEEFVESVYSNAAGWNACDVDKIYFESDYVIIECHSTFRGEWDQSYTFNIPYECFNCDRPADAVRDYFQKLKVEKLEAEQREKQRLAEEAERQKEENRIKREASDRETYIRLKAKYEGTNAQ